MATSSTAEDGKETVVKEIPPALDKLLLLMVKNFYTQEQFLLVYYIMRAICIKEEKLRERVQFEHKQMREWLAQLKRDKIIRERLITQKNDNNRNDGLFGMLEISLLARFNEQMLPMFTVIRELAGIQLAPHLCEPDINKYIDDPAVQQLQQQQQELDFSSQPTRASLGGVAFKQDAVNLAKMMTSEQITVDLNAGTNQVEEKQKEMPAWLAPIAMGEEINNVEIFNDNQESTTLHLSMLAELEGGTNEPEETNEESADQGEALPEQAEEQESEEEEETPEVTVQGVKYAFDQVTPDMIEQMTEAEQETYNHEVWKCKDSTIMCPEKFGLFLKRRPEFQRTSKSLVKEVPTQRKTTQFKRVNSKRPREISSKKPVSKFRDIYANEKKTERISIDPRFDSRYGELNQAHFERNYTHIHELQLSEITAREHETNERRKCTSLQNSR
ncbi:unnamed protein product, partial [Mesorhabditis belari]|uniref:rRNA biogenesis protein RRP36 n=1 Tax=Mesorhabditis belari TaxID=2138241 RepID=A0AAF3FR36_9BILA